MIDFIEGKGDTNRQQILLAASRQFAVVPYNHVNLDDIVTTADVTKGVL